MPTPFPHEYSTDLHWTGDSAARIESPPRPAIEGGPPPQFDGSDRVWSPEHLLLASENLCLMATFMAIAKHSKLEVLDYKSRATGKLEKTEKGIVFTAIGVDVTCGVKAGDEEKALKTLESAQKHCIVSNSLNVPITLTPRILVRG